MIRREPTAPVVRPTPDALMVDGTQIGEVRELCGGVAVTLTLSGDFHNVLVTACAPTFDEAVLLARIRWDETIDAMVRRQRLMDEA